MAVSPGPLSTVARRALLAVSKRPRHTSGASRAQRARWWLTFAILFVMSAAWSLATPLIAAPDEAAHIIKAAAVARGEFFGTPDPSTRSGPSPDVTVRVPAVFAPTHGVSTCFAFHPDVPASCAPAIRGSSALTDTKTLVGRYEPLYYAVVGLPSLPFPSAAGIRLMRLLSALLCCLFLACAMDSVVPRRRAPAVLGTSVAVTPMVLFLSGTVNPNSLEICTALSLWCSGLVLATDDSGPPSKRMIACVGVSAAVLVEMRSLSLLWLALIGVSLLALSSRRRLAAIAWERASWAWGGVVVLSTAFSGWWLLRYDPLAVLPISPTHASLVNNVEQALGQTESMMRQMVGVVGWLDTPAPALTYYGWLALVAVALGVGLAVGRRHAAWVLAGVTTATIAVPVLVGASEASTFGVVWQGRYTLPLAVGIPVVAAFALPATGRHRPTALRPVLLVAVVVVAAQLGMFIVALRRYTVGESGTLDPFAGSWHPPLGSIGVTVLFLVGLLVYGFWVVALARRDHALMSQATAPVAPTAPVGPTPEAPAAIEERGAWRVAD